MGDFGLTTEGFNAARFSEVRAAIIETLQDVLGQNIQTDDKSVIGVLSSIFGEREADAWNTAEELYASAYLGSSTGQALDDLVALAGIPRQGATFSVAELTLIGDNGTTVPAGSVVRDPVTLTRWITSAAATIPVTGSIAVDASPDATGAVVALSASITEIVTPVTGWTSATNLLDATVGRAGESDAALRARFIEAFRLGGGSSDEAIRAVLLNLADVTLARVVSNRSNITDADGRPPHSLEAIVIGGTDQVIFDGLWASIPSGIQPFGVNATGTVIDSVGNSQVVEFTRPIDLPFYIRILYEAEENAPSDIEDLALAEILEFGSFFVPGQNVIPFKFVQNIETVGFQDMIFNVGLAATPVLNDPIDVSARNTAKFDSTRVQFVRTN